MKNSCVNIVLLFIGIFFCFDDLEVVSQMDNPSEPIWNTDSLDVARDVPYLSDLEKDVILEHNMVRTNPMLYAETFIKPRKQTPATKECYEQMMKMAPMPMLFPSKGLSKAAEFHAQDCYKNNFFNHWSSDRTSPSDRIDRYGEYEGTFAENLSAGFDNNEARNIVIQLLIDEGVPSRGHRHNILNDELRMIGVACGNHKTYKYMCVLDYASDFADKQ